MASSDNVADPTHAPVPRRVPAGTGSPAGSPCFSVALGSGNPVKARAVATGFQRLGFPVTVHPFPVSSGVSEQPMSAEETIVGARQRCAAAAELMPEADFFVGTEGGLQQVSGFWFETGWMCVRDSHGVESLSATVAFPLPELLLPYLLAGQDLDEAVEAVVGTEDIGSSTGFCGLVTDMAVDRFHAYADAISVALSRWAHPEMWVAAPPAS